MACKSIIPKGWLDANTVENQCHLMDAICAETVTLQIKKLCKRLDLSEEEIWSLYGLENETSARAEIALGPLVFRPSCYGFTIPKRCDKAF
jgi:hypothetical protein